MTTVQLRVATSDDADALLDMMVDFNQLEEVAWSRASGAVALATLLSSPALGAACFLVEDERVCGYFVVTWGFDLEWAGRDAFLTELYLRPEARGRGLGRLAMPLVEGFARQHGARALHLMARHENEPALRLYRGAGFTTPPRVFLTKPLVTGG